jgi:hypothetical protein
MFFTDHKLFADHITAVHGVLGGANTPVKTLIQSLAHSILGKY